MQVVIQIFSLPLVKFSVIKSMIGTCMQRKNLLWICDRSKKKKMRHVVGGDQKYHTKTQKTNFVTE